MSRAGAPRAAACLPSAPATLCRVDRSLRLGRVLALVGGLALVAAFFMPWFSSQGLLLSGQFLHTFLASASPTDLRRFLPTSSPSEVQALRLLVDLFPACGAVIAVAALIGGLALATRTLADVVLAVASAVPLVAWAIGITRLPPGANFEIGLWLILAGAVAALLGVTLDRLAPAPRKIAVDFAESPVDSEAHRSTSL
jgi:hypothetical protein